MKRRSFVVLGLAGVACAVGLPFAFSSTESAIEKVLRKKLSYLKLDDAGVRQFASDVASRKAISKGRLLTIDAAGPLYTRLSLADNNKFDNAIRHGEERVVSLYLMSSDFFRNGADESRVVQYTGYYDPLVACNNPFARPCIPGEAA